MSNLAIEGLSKITQTGGGQQISSDMKVAQEMRSNGMDLPSGDAHVNAGSFSDILRSSVEKVNEMQTQSDSAIKELVAGRSKNIHETMLTIERADTSLKLMMQVRNKILDAYKEIMHMQV